MEFKDLSDYVWHLPSALHDVIRHEDADLVREGARGIILHCALPTPIDDASPASKIFKTPDSGLMNQQNMDLLISDYLRELPHASAHTREGEQLMEHWRQLIQSQPQRIAQAQQNFWHSEKAKAFWHERMQALSKRKETLVGDFPYGEGDWEKAAGSYPVPDLRILGKMQERKWQDLVIRSRLHTLERALYEYYR